MLVNITARILDVPSLATNRPAQDWPISLRVEQSGRETHAVLVCEGSVRAGELRAVVMMPGALASNEGAAPEFVKSLMGRNVAVIRGLEVPESGIRLLLDSVALPLP